MIRKEISLIINSILIPLAAGLFIFLAGYRILLSDSPDGKSAIDFTGTGMALVGPVILLGILISLSHLGNPFRAYRSIRKIDTSWLSREVFFTGAFFGLWLVYYVLESMGINNSYVISLTILSGILSIVSMANIYYSTGKPVWSGFNTYTGFLGSVIILGSVGSAALVVSSGSNKRDVAGLLVIAVLLALMVLVVRFIQQMALFGKLKTDDGWNIDNLVSGSSLDEEIISRYKMFMISGWALSFIGVITSLVFLKNSEALSSGMVIALCFVIVFAGEFLERCGFYILGPE